MRQLHLLGFAIVAWEGNNHLAALSAVGQMPTARIGLHTPHRPLRQTPAISTQPSKLSSKVRTQNQLTASQSVSVSVIHVFNPVVSHQKFQI